MNRAGWTARAPGTAQDGRRPVRWTVRDSAVTVGRAPRRRPAMGALVLAWCTVFLTLALGASPPARAYVRTLSMTDQPFFWPCTTVPFTAYPRTLPALTADQFGDAVTAAAQAWSRQDPTLAACTSLELPVSLADPMSTPPMAAFDHTNNVVMLTDKWSGDPAALAITSVFTLTSGRILDSDIEVNGVQFAWTDRVLMPAAASNSPDLQNALTHEMGHAIGLAHTCYLAGNEPPATDETGAPIPDCGRASDAVRATTMFPSSDPLDISKRTLAADDQKAVCDIYPLNAGPQICSDDAGADASLHPDAGAGAGAGGGGCGCRMASDRKPGGVVGGLVFLSLLFLGIRRRVRHRHQGRRPHPVGGQNSQSF